MPEIGQNTQQVAAQITDAPPLLRSPAGLGLDVQATATRLVSSPALVGSVVFCIGRARENLRSLRDQIPSELWEQINQFHLQLRQSSSSQSKPLPEQPLPETPLPRQLRARQLRSDDGT